MRNRIEDTLEKTTLNPKLLLIGNKKDLKREVPKERAIKLASEYGMYYEEVSAKTG